MLGQKSADLSPQFGRSVRSSPLLLALPAEVAPFSTAPMLLTAQCGWRPTVRQFIRPPVAQCVALSLQERLRALQ